MLYLHGITLPASVTRENVETLNSSDPVQCHRGNTTCQGSLLGILLQKRKDLKTWLTTFSWDTVNMIMYIFKDFFDFLKF